MSGPIALSRMHFPVTALGPGRRLGIWFQGCSIRCPGCISMDTWAPGRGTTTVEEMLEVAAPWIAEADGITISGGEPFDQPDALVELLRRVRSATEIDVLVFTGNAWPGVALTVQRADGLIDALITGPFDQSETQTLALRGSDNQELHLLTQLGRERFAAYDRRISDADRKMDAMFDENGDVWFAGIPARDDFHRLRQILVDAGATFDSSADRRPQHDGISST
jgi:anaerobic ribonucleoside-triphosphate reductase activating protein